MLRDPAVSTENHACYPATWRSVYTGREHDPGEGPSASAQGRTEDSASGVGLGQLHVDGAPALSLKPRLSQNPVVDFAGPVDAFGHGGFDVAGPARAGNEGEPGRKAPRQVGEMLRKIAPAVFGVA